MTVLPLILALVLPVDRLAMADRMFNRGEYAQAAKEYAALKAAEGIAADGLIYRSAECARLMGDGAQAKAGFLALLAKFPDSGYAADARLKLALSLSGDERLAQLRMLDSDRVNGKIRAVALYHLGAETEDLVALERATKLDPKGSYAEYALIKRASIMEKSPDEKVRRQGLELLLGIAFGKGPLAEEALYLTAIMSYRMKRYTEASSLFRRFAKRFGDSPRISEVKTLSVWCDYLSGHYAEAMAACGEGASDDLAYLRAASAYAVGDREQAKRLFKKYLEDYPAGRYRRDVELPLARLGFDSARSDGNDSALIEYAKTAFVTSGSAADELRLAWAYEKRGNQEAARAEYAKIAATFPKSSEAAEAQFLLAMLEARTNKWAAAELSLAEALATGKLEARRMAEAKYWQGVALVKLNHPEESVAPLKAALEAGLGVDEAREARLLLADWDLRNNRVEAAKEEYRKLVAEGAVVRMSAARILEVGRLTGGDCAEICAKALCKSEAAEWRQAGWAMVGEIEESRQAYAAAIAAYRQALAEKAQTEFAASSALKLGKLETRAGEFEAAEKTLERAVRYNVKDVQARGEAYLALAENALANGDRKAATVYATVVVELFEGSQAAVTARKILEADKSAAK